MSIKKEDRAFLDESLRGQISRAQVTLHDALEQVCLRGDAEDLERLDQQIRRYTLLLKASSLLTDACA